MHEKHMMEKAIEEIKGAKKYMKCAMKYKKENSVWAKKFFEMAQDEARHAEAFVLMADSTTNQMTELEKEYFSDQKRHYTHICAMVRVLSENFQKA